mgnify:FL=1
MAETLSYDNTPQTEVLSADEQDSLQVGEKLVAEQEKLLAGKYNSPEELEKAYLELQSKLGKGEEAEQTEGETNDSELSEEDPQYYLEDGSINYEQVSNDYGSEISNVFQEKGIDPYEINKHFHDSKGEITDEDYSQLEQAGFSKELVDAYLNGRAVESGYLEADSQTETEVDISQRDVDSIQNSVGGAKEYTNIVSWAANNLPEEQVVAYDNLVASGNVEGINLALQGLKAQYDEAFGSEGRTLQGRAPRSNDGVYRSQAELMSAMNDPRYDYDEAYRDDVLRKLENSDIQF